MIRALLIFLLNVSPLIHADDAYWISGKDDVLENHKILKVYGAADFSAIEPILKNFALEQDNLSVLYREFSTRELYRYVTERGEWPDILLSPAMDLQVKLINDGYAIPFESESTSRLPKWASWRNELYAFTYEPVAIAINRRILGDDDLVPKDRTELLNLIRSKESLFRGKIGLLDLETVGLGYLMWANDSQQSRTYGRLLEVFGANRAKLYPNSTSMLQALAQGDIYIAYNVLGSYASEWAARFNELSVILPNDYTAVILRSALIPKAAQLKNEAKLFINYLLSEKTQRLLSEHSSLIPISSSYDTNEDIATLRQSELSPLQPINLGFPLLLLTDQAKRSLLLKEWDNAIQN
ncbi:ABC transporter substrate-binding protein [Marinomonas ostreistagni]|uniref:ABC transporter substrate-binding protein n=1 Tax=Marinomonas ostreistagni TaxID=359209 RepID=A0ABS0ZFN4_9GAMM|nr:ABC transporter substrate-binding protein [Marinomonas ostreistagni]MBJ7552479.1 ABC transporter substrate-binding protein [Marinomonas ostreistagni]